MIERSRERFEVSGRIVDAGEELDEVSAGIMSLLGLGRGVCAGEADHVQLDRAPDDVFVRVGRDDVLRSGFLGGLDQRNAGDSAGADQHFAAHQLTRLADGILGMNEGSRILLVEGDFHQLHAAFIERLCNLRNLFFVSAADDCNDLVLKDGFNDLFTHDIYLHVFECFII